MYSRHGKTGRMNRDCHYGISASFHFSSCDKNQWVRFICIHWNLLYTSHLTFSTDMDCWPFRYKRARISFGSRAEPKPLATSHRLGLPNSFYIPRNLSHGVLGGLALLFKVHTLEIIIDHAGQKEYRPQCRINRRIPRKLLRSRLITPALKDIFSHP
jgi:hypothetical protein